MSADAPFEPSVPIAQGGDAPFAYAECIRIARRLRVPGMSPIGLLPAGDESAVAPVGIALASAMVDVSSAKVAYIDALGRIATQREGAEGDMGEVSFHWQRSRMSVVTPVSASRPPRQRLAAEYALAEASRTCRHVLVDLSGFGRMGELPRIMASMKSVALIAGRLATREATLLELDRWIPASKRLGALLVD